MTPVVLKKKRNDKNKTISEQEWIEKNFLRFSFVKNTGNPVKWSACCKKFQRDFLKGT